MKQHLRILWCMITHTWKWYVEGDTSWWGCHKCGTKWIQEP